MSQSYLALFPKWAPQNPMIQKNVLQTATKLWPITHDLRQSHIALLVVQSKENRIKYPVAVSPHHGSCFVYPILWVRLQLMILFPSSTMRTVHFCKNVVRSPMIKHPHSIQICVNPLLNHGFWGSLS